MGSDKQPRLLFFTCLLLWFGLLVFGLWPFNFFPHNKVSWIRSGRGVHFERYGLIYGEAPLSFSGLQAKGSKPFSIELWVIPQAGYQVSNAILCIYDSSSPSDLMVAQSGSDLVLIGSFRDRKGVGAVRHLWLDDAARTAAPRFLSVISGNNGTALYLDGKQWQSSQYEDLLPQSYSGRLLLGQSPSGDEPWSGTILGLAFYDRVLSPQEIADHYQAWQRNDTEQLRNARALYTFAEEKGDIIHNRAASTAPDLFIPTRFERFHPKILEFPHPFKKSDVKDAVINIVGFIPFGFLLTLYLQVVRGYSKARALLLGLLLGGITSLLIELAQVLLPTRDSSALDLINNVIGTLAGSALVIGIHDRLSRFLAGM